MNQYKNFQIRNFFELDSTNEKAKELAKDQQMENIVVVADYQICGRGRKGRAFYSPAGKGLYMSMLLRPGLIFQDALQITTMTAVAVSRAIEKCCRIEPDEGKEARIKNPRVTIKWVNDLFINGKKICGILTETGQNFQNGVPDYVIVGIGINVEGLEFPEEIKNVATSLEKELGQAPDKEDLLKWIIREFEELYVTLPNSSYMEEYRKRSMVLGKKIRVIQEQNSYEANVLGIDDRAGLVIESANGREVLSSGEITIRMKE